MRKVFLMLVLAGVCGSAMAEWKEMVRLNCVFGAAIAISGSVEADPVPLQMLVQVSETVRKNGSKAYVGNLDFGQDFNDNLVAAELTEAFIDLKTPSTLVDLLLSDLKPNSFVKSYVIKINRFSGGGFLTQTWHFGQSMAEKIGSNSSVFSYTGKCSKADVADRKF
jgi:hypothetical protein